MSGHNKWSTIKHKKAAADAKACQIDGVYLHGHEGYLLEQFANPAFNRRRLGRYANWERLGLDLVREIHAMPADGQVLEPPLRIQRAVRVH